MWKFFYQWFNIKTVRKYAARVRINMVDKRFWSNILYVVIIFVVCYGVLLKISTYPEPIPTLTFYTLYSNNSTYSHPFHSLPLDDYHQLIDLHNFTFTMLNLPCNDSSPLLLVLVHSAPKNWEIRNVVRTTWGRTTSQVKVLFLIGSFSNATLTRSLERENELHGDLIQGTFQDSYRNMTYKHVMLLKYAVYHCPQAKYILKTDDDVFVNMPLMLDFLTVKLSPFGGSKVLFCNEARTLRVLRSYRSKWRVSFKEYAARSYPNYCLGWAILYSPDVAFALYREAQKSPYFWIDDVHVTGTLAQRLNLNHVDTSHLALRSALMRSIIAHPATYNHTFLYGAVNVDNSQIRALWDYVKSHRTPISLLKEI